MILGGNFDAGCECRAGLGGRDLSPFRAERFQAHFRHSFPIFWGVGDWSGLILEDANTRARGSIICITGYKYKLLSLHGASVDDPVCLVRSHPSMLDKQEMDA